MYAVPFVWGSTAIAYNTELMAEAPTSMSILFDEAYAGKVTMRDDYNDAIMAAAMVLGQDPNNPSDLDAVKELLIKQKELNKTYWQTGDEFSKLFVSGQIAAGMMWSGQASTMKQEGEPIGFVVPEDGGIGWVGNWGIPASSQNKDLAYKFIDWMISKDFQYEIIRHKGLSSKVMRSSDSSCVIGSTQQVLLRATALGMTMLSLPNLLPSVLI